MNDVSPGDWARIKTIVTGALAQPDAERPAYLDAHCRPEGPFRRQVESLLAAAVDAADLYEHPVLLVGQARITPDALDGLVSEALPLSLNLGDAPGASQELFGGTSRYHLHRRIGIGGMGVVYEVEDRTRNQVVALKTLRRWDPADIYRLKREFRTLADIAHPNLVSLYELVVGEDECFFTMELIDGVGFVDRVRDPSADTVDFHRIRRLLPQLVEAVEELHRHGMLHRDIKPSNVLVTPDDRVVVLDFGLTADLAGHDEFVRRYLIGTPAYLSPEQCRGLEASAASDWYSVGAMLYHALTGKAPFDSGLLDVIERKTTSDPPAPCTIAPDVPRDLEDVCMSLLCRDPALRLTGRSALERLKAIPAAAFSKETRPRSVFVGREHELAVLTMAFAAVKEGRSASVYIHGPSGIGKSALVQRFIHHRLGGEPAVVLRSRCHEHESMPYKGLDGAIDSLSRYLRALPEAELVRMAPRDLPALTRLFPVLPLPAFLPRQQHEPTDPVALRRRAFAALRQLLANIADRQPLILDIDDFHWADRDSADSLVELLRPPDPPPLLLLVSFRSEEIDAKPFLRSLIERVELGTKIALPLAPLTAHESSRLIATLLEDADTADSTGRVDIARQAAGNPYLVEELTRYASLGVSWRRGATLGEMLQRRLDALPREARAFLEVLAVCGRPIRPARILEACGLAGDERPLVARLRAAHFVRSSRSAGHVEMYHDRIRETLASAVDAPAARQIHELMARILVAHGDDDPEALFEHYRAAGETALAAAQAALAAARASQVLAFDRAAAFYRHALELQPDDRHRVEWLERLANALENGGRPGASADSYLAAAQESDGVARTELMRKGAEQLLIGGHIDRGLDVIQTVLETAGIRLARGPRAALASILLRRAQLLVRGLEFTPRDTSQIAPEDLLRIDACWSITTGLAMVDNIRAASFHIRQLLIALDTGEPYRVARALALEAGFSALGGGSGIQRSAAFSERARGMGERLQHPHVAGLAAMAGGIAAFVLGEFTKATALCQQALTILQEQCTGVIWEQTLAHVFFLGSLLFRGELRDVSHVLPGVLQSAQERGNLYFETELRTRMNLVWLANDQADEGERHANEAIARWSDSSFHRQHYNHLLARVQTELYRGRAPQAWDLVANRLAPVRRHLWLRVQFFRIETAYMRARCACAMAAEGRDVRRMLSTAAREAARIDRENMTWSNPLAMLIRATVAGLAGDTDAAATRLAAAIDAFEKADMNLYAAVSRRRLATLVGGDNGRALRRQADEWMAAQEIRNPMAIARLLAPGLIE